jgi:4-amino-4-deoxy-L-arabinose transferase-like glycosyltransferase
MSVTQERVAPEAVVSEKIKLKNRGKVSLTWHQKILGGILLLSACLSLILLNPNSYTNEYYGAAVRSMLASWHNFFFNAYDPGGFITVDKPPVFLWLETASAWLFGYNGITILLPSALAGVGSVALLYSMVKRWFGPVAGLAAAFALAVTPISVVMNRHNNPESILIFFMLLGAWAVSRATDKGRLSWLVLGMAMIGVAFNVKMLEAFVILPALYLLYFVFANTKWWKRIIHLAVASVVLVVVSLSWAVIVDLTPAGQRPYIGSSGNNTVMNLIFNYNGLNRIEGNNFGGNRNGQPGSGFQPPNNGSQNGSAQQNNGSGQNSGTNQNGNGRQSGGFRQGGNFGQNNGTGQNSGSQQSSGTQTNTGNQQNNGTQQGAGTPPNNGSGQNGGFRFPGGFGQNGNGGPAPGGFGGSIGSVVAGQAGPFRMFDQALAGEAGWLLPLALLGLVIAAAQAWWRFPTWRERKPSYQGLVLWGGWLLTFMAVFSVAEGLVHDYYLVMLAPGVAALAGISLEALWHSYRQGGWQKWLLPVVLMVTTIFEFNLLSVYSNWNRALSLVMIGVELVCAVALLAGPRLLRPANVRWTTGVMVAGFLGLCAAPFAWSISDIVNKPYTNETLPTAVPVGANITSSFGFGRGYNNNSNTLLNNLLNNWNVGLTGLVAGLVVVGALMVGLRFYRRQLKRRQRLDQLATLASAALVVILGLSLAVTVLPKAASASTSTAPLNSGQIGNPQTILSNTDKLIAYLEANQDGYTYLLATSNSNNASPIIIKTGKAVMALGGFQGNDQPANAQQFAQMVQDKVIRFVLLDSGGFGRGGGQSATGWVQQNCQVVNSSLWSSTGANSQNNSGGRGGFGFGASAQLYDCAPQG